MSKTKSESGANENGEPTWQDERREQSYGEQATPKRKRDDESDDDE